MIATGGGPVRYNDGPEGTPGYNDGPVGTSGYNMFHQ